jgi:hypothetical protein
VTFTDDAADLTPLVRERLGDQSKALRNGDMRQIDRMVVLALGLQAGKGKVITFQAVDFTNSGDMVVVPAKGLVGSYPAGLASSTEVLVVTVFGASLVKDDKGACSLVLISSSRLHMGHLPEDEEYVTFLQENVAEQWEA